MTSPKLKESWSEIAAGLDVIFTGKELGVDGVMRIYTLIYKLCIGEGEEEIVQVPKLKTAGEDKKQAFKASDEIEYKGKSFYPMLVDHLEKTCGSKLEGRVNLEGADLLARYEREWTQYKEQLEAVNNLFFYLNTHWIARELNERGSTEVFTVKNLAIGTWKKHFIPLAKKISATIIHLIGQERAGQKIDSEIMKRVVAAYDEVDIKPEKKADEKTEAASAEGVKPEKSEKLSLYEEYIEKDFLQQVRDFLTTESADFLKSHSIVEYMEKVESRINEEIDRCTRYLATSTLKPLESVLTEVLVRDHIRAFQADFKTMVLERQDDNLRRVFILCDRVETGVTKLQETIKEIIERAGAEAFEQIKSEEPVEPKKFIETILSVHRRFAEIINGPLQKDPRFAKALDEVLMALVNKNVVIPNSSKAADLLARYCDSLLKKSSSTMDDSKMDELLTEMMTVFKYVSEKDIFEKYYQKLLSNRIIYNMSANWEAESSVINKLQDMMGQEYTTKLHRMYTDMNLSKDICDKYKAKDSSEKKEVDFGIMVLTASYWPLQLSSKITLAPQLNALFEDFDGHYKSTHTGRRLELMPSQSRGELVCTAFPNSKYTLVGTSQQLSLLMLFNDADELTISALLDHLNTEIAVLAPIVHGLVKAGLLTISEELDVNVAGSALVKINKEFTSKKHRVDLLRSTGPAETKKEDEELMKVIEHERRYVVSAAIVRIMKASNQKKHNELIAEVLKALHPNFSVQPRIVKIGIDDLIQREYIKRAERDKDVYEYIA